MPAVAKTTPQRAGRRRSSIGGRIILSDRKNTPSQTLRKTPVKTKKTTPPPWVFSNSGQKAEAKDREWPTDDN